MSIELILADHPIRAVEALAHDLQAHRPSDPFEPQVVWLTDPSLEGWVKTWIAHHAGIAANLRFVSLREGLLGAWAPADDRRKWWEPLRQQHLPDGATQRHPLRALSEGELVRAVLAAWGDRTHPDLKTLRDALGDSVGSADGRAMALAEQVARWLDEDFWEPTDAQDWQAWTRDQIDDPRSLVLRTPHSQRAVLFPSAGAPRIRLFGATALSTTERRLLAELGAEIAVFRPTAAPSRWTGSATPPLHGTTASRLLRVESHECAQWRQSGASIHIHEPGSPRSRPGSPTLSIWQEALRDPTAPTTSAPATESDLKTAFLPAWTPRREVEQLRHRLLKRFSETDLSPRDVLILTPEMDVYGHLIASIFSQSPPKTVRWMDDEAKTLQPPRIEADAPAAIPTRLVGLGLSQTNPVATALLTVLELCSDRVTAGALHTLACMPVVQKRFGIPTGSEAELETLLRESNAAWGIEGADKESVYGLALERNSMDFAMQRLAASAFLHHERGPGDDSDTQNTLNPTSQPRTPLAAATPERRALAAQLARLTNRLRATRSQLLTVDRRPPAEWYRLMRTSLEGFTQTGATTSFLTREVEDTLERCLHPDPAQLIPGSLSLEELRQAIRDRFERPLSVKADFGGAVRVQRLRPGGIPARPLIIFLGLGSGSYPRRPRRPSWWPKPSNAVPSTDGILLQRQAFAEAILAAESEVWLSWTARELNKGGELPPSSLVGELEDLLSLSEHAQKVCRTPAGRHPWSESAPVALDVAGWAAQLQAAQPSQVADGEVPARRLTAWSMKGDGTTTGPPSTGQLVEALTVSQMVSQLLNGPKIFLHKRLGVFLDKENAPLPEREPFAAAPLGRHALKEESLERLQALPADADDADIEDTINRVTSSLLARHEGLGDLALGPGAEEDLHKAATAAMDVLLRARAIDGAVEEQVNLVWTSPANSEGRRTRLSCRVPFVYTKTRDSDSEPAQLHQWVTVAASKHTVRQTAWIALCMARLSGHPVEAARIVTAKGTEWLVPRCDPTWTHEWMEHVDRQSAWMSAPGEQLARQALLQRLRILQDAKRSPIPLFKRTSMAVAEKVFGNVPTKNRSILDLDRKIEGKKAEIEAKRIVVNGKKPGSVGRQTEQGRLDKLITALEKLVNDRAALEQRLPSEREAWQTGGAHKAATGAAAGTWYTTFRSTGEEEDPWVQRVLPSYDPVATIRDDDTLLRPLSTESSRSNDEALEAYTFISAMKLVWEDLAESILSDATQKWCSDMTKWRKS